MSYPVYAMKKSVLIFQKTIILIPDFLSLFDNIDMPLRYRDFQAKVRKSGLSLLRKGWAKCQKDYFPVSSVWWTTTTGKLSPEQLAGEPENTVSRWTKR